MKPIEISQWAWEELWRIHAAARARLPVHYSQIESILDDPRWPSDPSYHCACSLLDARLVFEDNLGLAALPLATTYQVVLLVHTGRGVLVLGKDDPDYLDDNNNLLALPAEGVKFGVGA